MSNDPLHWTDVATAIGTVGAVVTALWFGLVEARRSHRDERVREAAAVRAQAAQIAAWIEVKPFYTDDVEGGPAGYHGTVSVTNPSPLPIYEARLQVMSRDTAEYDWDPFGAAFAHEYSIGVVPPGVTRTREFHDVDYTEDAPIQCAFRDAADRWWLHTEAGYLHPLAGRPTGD